MQSFINFFKESWAELKQVAWLPVPHMIASTWMVIVLVIVMAIYVGGVDFILKTLFSVLI
jgi:preprotein translocase SecE subunit